MSTIREIIARVDENRPNAFSSATKMKWISDLDGKIAADVFLMDIAQIRELEYRHPDGLEQEPLVTFPHDDIYDLWLEAKIDAANGEYNRYQNTMQLYNESFGNFVRWFASVYEPAQGEQDGCFVPRSNVPTYYLTAYGIAVKRGFVGTVDEWLASLKGEKGDPGTDPAAIQQAVEKTVPGVVEQVMPGAVNAAVADAVPDAVNQAVGGAVPGAVEKALSNVPEPEEENDAANKAYVDNGLAGKAPAGYGLGIVTVLKPEDISFLDTLVVSGWYTLNFDIGDFLTLGYWVKYVQVRVDAYNNESCTQTVRRSDLDTVVQRHMVEGVWQPWEFVNPSVDVGVEYRTTERYNGKAVYTKLFDCGQLATASGKYFSHGINGVMLRCVGCMSKDGFATATAVPYCVLNETGTVSSEIAVSSNATHILIFAKFGNFTDYTMRVQLWYTKD